MVSPIVYVGGKHLLRRWILDQLPKLDDWDTYVELFLGGGHVFFELYLRDQARSIHRNYVLNDRDEEVTNFYRVLRNRPRALRLKLQATPYSRSEFRAAWEYPPGLSDLERARRFFVRVRQGVAGRLSGRSGWGRAHNAGARVLAYRNAADHLDQFNAALRAAYIENGDWGDVLATWDGPRTLVYADPPYVGCERAYRVRFADDAHARLAGALAVCQSQPAVSYYPHDLVKRLSPRSAWDWQTRSVPVSCHVVSNGQARQRAVECLIIRR